jgi:hypothetical protein
MLLLLFSQIGNIIALVLTLIALELAALETIPQQTPVTPAVDAGDRHRK